MSLNQINAGWKLLKFEQICLKTINETDVTYNNSKRLNKYSS